jgi:hypothetical protein
MPKELQAQGQGNERKEVDPFLAAKAEAARRIAQTRGLISKGSKSRRLSVRMSEALMAAAKERTGISSDSELIEAALANLAVDDDFGQWLLAQRGRLPKDFKLEL